MGTPRNPRRCAVHSADIDPVKVFTSFRGLRVHGTAAEVNRGATETQVLDLGLDVR